MARRGVIEGIGRFEELYSFTHCSVKFKQEETWYLKDNKNFCNRRLEIGICPLCEYDIVAFIETRISDKKEFIQIETEYKALDIVEHCKCEVKRADKTVPKGRLYGFVYGVNKEIHNRKGEVTKIRQRACDWQGQKVLVRETKVKQV